MNHRRSIEKFISSSIKKESETIDETPLNEIFDKMTTEEINMWWILYSGSMAYSDAHIGNGHWETKKIEKKLDIIVGEYHYLPKEKDENGKYILVRDDLILHIKKHISAKIESGIQSNIDFKNRSFIGKFEYYLGILSLLTIPIFMIIFLFPKSEYFIPILTICSIIFLTHHLLFPITSFIIQETNGMRRKKENS